MADEDDLSPGGLPDGVYDATRVLAILYRQCLDLTNMMNFIMGTLLENGTITDEQVASWNNAKRDDYLLRLTKISMMRDEAKGDK